MTKYMTTNMADVQNIEQLELLCRQLYETVDGEIRVQAEKALLQFSNSPECLTKCQLLLERGESPYAQLLAATTLTKLVSRPNPQLPVEHRLDIKNYILNYLASRPNLASFATQALVQLFSRLIKLSWFDTSKDERLIFQDSIGEVKQFIDTGSTHHILLGVQLLSQIVSEMNQMTESEANRSLSRHRKIASSFRDSQLQDIYELTIGLLKKMYDAIQSVNFSFNDAKQSEMILQTLRLAHNCLSFDFLGTSSDESTDDLFTVQVPTTWRSLFVDSDPVQLFTDLYAILPAEISPMALSCLVQIASVRRSLFNNAERAKFLNQLIASVQRILRGPQILADSNNYHEFCRLLARLKSNYQLGELVRVDDYPILMKLIAEFTVTSLQAWNYAPNSVHYLLSLWQRMVASVPYVKASEPHLLETYSPEVTKAYITSRLDSVAIIVRDGLEDPLDDESLVQQLEQISTISRCDYRKTCALLIPLFDEAAQRYEELLSLGQTSGINLAIQEGQLTWLVYIIGAVIGGRVSFASTDEHDALDGELVCRVLQLMKLTDSRLMQAGCEKLDVAMLSFFEQFRKIYIGDQVQKTSRVYRRLSEVLGLSDESMVLGVFVGKVITNLKYWGRSEPIISRTLQLLNDLSVGYSCVRKLVKLDAVQFLLANHTSEHFPFLEVENSGSPAIDMRCRTTFYTALGRLLMVDLGEDEDQFEQFMRPLTNSFESVHGIMSQTNSNALYSTESLKRQLVGLARDLRGVAFAFNSKVSYMMLFDWIFPTYTRLLIQALELWYHDPTVTTPILKLFMELAQNRSQRLQFDVSSPNGVLLLKEVSKVILTYGSRILSFGSIPKDQIYGVKLKGIAICFAMLKATLSGNYVNFGVFQLYGDTSLEDALNMFIKLLLSVAQSDLLAYPKLSQSYYALLECLAQDHMAFMSNLEPQVFMYIMATISEGLTALDTMVCTGCCGVLDNVLTFLYRRLTRKTKKSANLQQTENDSLLRTLELNPEILQQMLATVLNIVMFEDCRNQWSMSRPLLGLILLNEEYFGKLREGLIASQSEDKQAIMRQCFENLMDGIDRTLQVKNRDRFTQNLSIFRRDMNDSLRNQPASSAVNIIILNDMM